MRSKAESFKRRVIPGEHRFIVQYSPQHSILKRPSTVSSVRAVLVVQQFDRSRFNFTRAAPEEIMMRISWRNGEPQIELSEGGEGHPVLINVSPLCVYTTTAQSATADKPAG